MREGLILMTVRNLGKKDVARIEKIGRNMITPSREHFIDHLVYFKNGAVVAYDSGKREGFVWVVKARD